MMKLTRIDETYAWGECEEEKNTVKFDADGSVGVCPACSVAYRCDGDTAQRVGAVVHDDPDDPHDPGALAYDVD